MNDNMYNPSDFPNFMIVLLKMWGLKNSRYIGLESWIDGTSFGSAALGFHITSGPKCTLE